MSGPVENAIRAHVIPGSRLPTPTGNATFLVHELREFELILLLGEKQTWTPLSWDCLEGTLSFLRGRAWVRVGANRDPSGDPATLDGYLKGCMTYKRQTANYVAVLLERAGLVDVDRNRPASVRLRILE